MRVLFSNPPWWQGTVEQRIKNRYFVFLKSQTKWERGVRAGSRWPHTYVGRSSPDKPVFRDYLSFPFFLSTAASYVKSLMTGDIHVELRDSIARAESYQSFFSYIKSGNFSYIIIESASPSWAHDSEIVLKLTPNNSKSCD